MSQKNEAPEKQTKDEFGELIQRARKAKKLSTKDLADHLNFTPAIIENLESENFSDLPPPMFVRGYIRAVSQYLGLNADELLSVYNKHGFSDPSLTTKIMPEPSKGFDVNWAPLFKLLKWLLILGALGGLIWIGLTQLNTEQTHEDGTLPLNNVGESNSTQLNLQNEPSSLSLPAPSTPSVSAMPVKNRGVVATDSATHNASQANTVSVSSSNRESTPSVSTQQSNANSHSIHPKQTADTQKVSRRDVAPSVNSEDAQSSTPTATKMGVSIKVSGESWVRVTDSRDRVLLSRLLKKDQERNLLGKAPYQLSIGNARVVKVEYNGKPFDHTGFINRNNVAKFTLN